MKLNKYDIAILGAGESGVGAAILAKMHGFDVFVSDFGMIKEVYKEELISNEIEFEEGGHSLDLILGVKEIIKSPGIPDKAQIIKDAKRRSISVVSEIEFAARYTNAKLVCITGSNGKTTTTLLTYHILKKAGLNVGLAGNIGNSFAKQVALNNYDFFVLELSSFQLDGMYDFRADISVLLNITPDHLDRYDYSFQNYIESKFRITQNQEMNDVFIYCKDDEVIMNHLKDVNIKAKMYPFSIKENVEEGAFLENDELNINLNKNVFKMKVKELGLSGKHNLYNSMAAGVAARVLDLRKEVVRESLQDFQNVEHRLEYVASVSGIEFVNDSKATNVNATWYALESTRSPIVWVVGGVDKGNDYEELMELVKDKVKAIVCIGKDNAKLFQTFNGVVPSIVEAESMDDAVRMSYDLGFKGDTVLLAPACASFDRFENYEDRGYQFKKAVKSL